MARVAPSNVLALAAVQAEELRDEHGQRLRAAQPLHPLEGDKIHVVRRVDHGGHPVDGVGRCADQRVGWGTVRALRGAAFDTHPAARVSGANCLQCRPHCVDAGVSPRRVRGRGGRAPSASHSKLALCSSVTISWTASILAGGMVSHSWKASIILLRTLLPGRRDR